MRNKISNSIGMLVIGAVMLAPSLTRAEEVSQQATLASRSTDIRIETVATRDQLKAAVNALAALTQQKSGDLRPNYETYVEEVKKTHAVAQQTSLRAGSMNSASKDYFGAWQTEISGIANVSLRKNAQKRMEDVRKSYDKVLASLRQAGVEFKPFLSDLDDVQKALANDITTGGVKAIRGTANDAVDHEEKVRRYINDAIDQLSRMEKALSPQKTP